MHLCLFLTYGTSLESWEEIGILDRELELYKEFQNEGHTVSIVTYSKKNERHLTSPHGLPDTLYNRWSLPTRLYAILVPYIFQKQILSADIVKTNQLAGAHVARRAARLTGKPLVVRQGFSQHEFRLKSIGIGDIRAKLSFAYERRELSRADVCIVTTGEMKNSILARHNVKKEKIFVIPNYVVPKLWSPQFRPTEYLGRPTKVCFIGRLVAQKNLDSLIHATMGMDVELHLIGDGPLQKYLSKLAKKLSVSCTFFGAVKQDEVAQILKGCDLFAFPSSYEGHPKALLEAMALGIPIVAADSPGIRNLIKPNENGLLVPGNPEGLRAGIRKLINLSLETRSKMGENSRCFSLKQFSVKKIAMLESALLEATVKQQATPRTLSS